MAKAKVFIFAPNDKTGESHKKLQDNGCELVVGKAGWHTPHRDNESEMVVMAQGAHALVGTSIRNSPISQEIMRSSKDLRVVAKSTIGVDDIDVEAATELGIIVCHAPTESNWGGVAEGTITGMLTMLKRVRERDRHLKSGGEWRDHKLQGTFVGSRESDGYPGIVLGIVGLGRVGGRVARLMKPWGVRMIAYDPYVPNETFQEAGVERVALPTLLRESDVVSLHVVLTKETRHMMGKEQFAQMKKGGIFINTSRGQCVHESDLTEALEREVISGAVLDVFEDEPLSVDSPLRKLGDKVILSAHMVSSNKRSGAHPGVAWATSSVLTALRGEVPDNVYNREVIDQWKGRFGGKSLL